MAQKTRAFLTQKKKKPQNGRHVAWSKSNSTHRWRPILPCRSKLKIEPSPIYSARVAGKIDPPYPEPRSISAPKGPDPLTALKKERPLAEGQDFRSPKRSSPTFLFSGPKGRRRSLTPEPTPKMEKTPRRVVFFFQKI